MEEEEEVVGANSTVARNSDSDSTEPVARGVRSDNTEGTDDVAVDEVVTDRFPCRKMYHRTSLVPLEVTLNSALFCFPSFHLFVHEMLSSFGLSLTSWAVPQDSDKEPFSAAEDKLILDHIVRNDLFTRAADPTSRRLWIDVQDDVLCGKCWFFCRVLLQRCR